MLLGQYFGETPEALQFEYSSLGRPGVSPRHNALHFSFNIAHSGHFALLGFGCGGPLGVDIEDLAVSRDICRLARAIFTSDDYREWRTLEAAARKAGLLRAWTRQEAVGKALGVGLSLTREQFAAALAGPDRLLVADIHIAESCVAAIATSGPELRPRLTEFLF